MPADAYTDQARVMVVEEDVDGVVVAYGVSEPFVIGAVTSVGDRPLRFVMMPAAPNPFAARTNILFELPEPGTVTMRVYGVDGRLVSVIADGRPYPAGRHALLWDGRNLQRPAGEFGCLLRPDPGRSEPGRAETGSNAIAARGGGARRLPPMLDSLRRPH